jgi:hypothetical protein
MKISLFAVAIAAVAGFSSAEQGLVLLWQEQLLGDTGRGRHHARLLSHPRQQRVSLPRVQRRRGRSNDLRFHVSDTFQAHPSTILVMSANPQTHEPAVTACARDCSGEALADTTIDPGCYVTPQSSALYECGSRFSVRGFHEALHKEALVNRAAKALGLDAKKLERAV